MNVENKTGTEASAMTFLEKMFALTCGALMFACGIAAASQDPAAFLRVMPGAQGAALGNTGVANPDSDFAAYFNPALTNLSENRLRFAAEQTQWLLDMQVEHYAITHSFGAPGAEPWSVSAFHSRWSTDPFETTDPDGSKAGELAYSAGAMGAAFSGAVVERVHVGVGIKRFYQTFEESGGAASGERFNAAGEMWTLGLAYATPRQGLIAGVSIEEPTGPVKFMEAHEEIPRVARAGLRGRYLNKLVRWSLEGVATGGELSWKSGLEFSPFGSLAMRAGFDNSTAGGGQLGVTTGVGLKLGGFRLDYSFVPFGGLGGTQSVSVAWRWGSRTREALEAVLKDERPQQQAALTAEQIFGRWLSEQTSEAKK